jgi:predicted esterase
MHEPRAVTPPPPAATDDRPVTVLVLHGGQEHSLRAARPWQLAALRMRPVAAALRAALRERPSARVEFVRYRVRGWNAGRADAAKDAAEAVARAAAAPGRPRIVLVGHSMGGRAALAAAAHPRVVGVVALAPWTPPGEPSAHLAGRRVRVLHAPEDRVTDPAESREFVRRARATGADATWQAVPGSDHAMLARARTWHRLAAAAALDCLAEPTSAPPQADTV